VYRYDPVGFMEELVHGAGGSAVSLIQPFMDNQVFLRTFLLSHRISTWLTCILKVEKKNSSFHTENVPRMTLEEAERCIHDAFISAAEREIHVGDSVHFKILTKDGIQEKYIMLRRD
jgi:20S proteasome subunit beta 6